MGQVTRTVVVPHPYPKTTKYLYRYWSVVIGDVPGVRGCKGVASGKYDVVSVTVAGEGRFEVWRQVGWRDSTPIKVWTKATRHHPLPPGLPMVEGTVEVRADGDTTVLDLVLDVTGSGGDDDARVGAALDQGAAALLARLARGRRLWF